MIAVEWSDPNGPRASNNNLCIRTGVLLQLGRGRVDGSDVDVAYVATRRMDHDHWVHPTSERRDGDYPTIIKRVSVDRLILKGTHIPFDPHGAGK